MMRYLFYITLLVVGYTLKAVHGVGDDVNHLRNLNLDGISPEISTNAKAKALSSELLQNVFQNRNKELIQRIDALTDVEMTDIKKKLHDHYGKAIKDEGDRIANELKKIEKIVDANSEADVDNLRNNVEERQKNLVIMKRKNEEISEMDGNKLKNKLKVIVEDGSKFEAIAVDVSVKGKHLVIAGNLKTRKIDDLLDLKLWKNVVKGEVRSTVGDNMYKDFGFQDGDIPAIREVLNKKEYAAWNTENGFQVEILKPAKVTNDQVLHLQNEIEKFKGALIEISSTSTAKFSQNQINGYNTKVNAAKNKLDKAEQALEVTFQAQPHAEMQLIKHRDDTKQTGMPRQSDHVIQASKSYCESCAGELGNNRKSMDFAEMSKHNTQGFKGMTNWLKPSEIQVETKLLTDWENEVIEKQKQASSSENLPIAGCSTSKGSTMRMKRSSSSCVFIIDTDTIDSKHKKEFKVDEIRSEEFLNEYKKADGKNKVIMADIAESNPSKLIGTSSDVQKVKSVVEYEKMKMHSAKYDNAVETLKTGRSSKTPGNDKYSESELLENTKLSPTKMKYQMGKRTTKVVGKLGKVSGSIGKFLLAKNVIQGIQSGDTTSLAIIGGTVGGGMGLELIGKYGPKLATKFGAKLGIKATANYLSAGFKTIGKVAGPLGAVADVGLSIWGLTKGIQRLNDPHATKFEQNEAIADIVQDSIDIVTTIVVTVASIAFPPLAPLFVVIGFFFNLFVSLAVTLYKAHNHVDSLHSKVKLLDFERSTEIGRYIGGKDTSLYFKDLIQVKNANNLLLKMLIDFLEQNPEYLGSVVPSRTFKLKGGCYLDRATCNFRTVLFGCWGWGETVRVADNCFGVGHECEDYWRDCKDSEKYEGIGIFAWEGYYWYYCKCPDKTRTELGYDEPNNKVDLREIRNIYVDRSAPDEMSSKWSGSYEVLCSPSSLYDRGYKVSERETQSGFLCERALGVQRTNGSGNITLFDLKDGTDSIYLPSWHKSMNHFLVGDGHKNFYGSGGEDTFMIAGPCKELIGTLDGVDQDSNTLVLNSDCNPAQSISVDFGSPSPRLKSGNGMVDITLGNIQKIYGRRGARDDIVVGCHTKFVGGSGGKFQSEDTVLIPYLENCSLAITVITSKYTFVEMTRPQIGHSIILIPSGDPGVSVTYSDPPSYTRPSGRAMILVNTSASLLTNGIIRHSNPVNIQLTFSTHQIITIQIQRIIWIPSDDQPEICFQEDNGLTSNLYPINNSQEMRIFHRLNGNGLRRGSKVLSNYFQIEAGNWDVIGGDLDDDFVVNGVQFQGKINGKGGVNSLHVGDAVAVGLEIDLVQGRLTSMVTSRLPNIKLFDIKQIIGKAGNSEIVTTGCTTKYVDMNGGSTVSNPDIVKVNHLGCNYNLTVVAWGHTKVESGFDQGELNLVIRQSNNSKVTMTHTAVGRSVYKIFIEFPVVSFTSVRLNQQRPTSMYNYIIDLLAPSGQHLELSLIRSKRQKSVDSDNRDDPHWSQPVIQFHETNGSPSLLIMSKSNGIPTSYHHLDTVVGTTTKLSRHGSKWMSNYFHLAGGHWDVFGGLENDVIELGDGFIGSIMCGHGTNTLYFHQGIHDPIIYADFPTGQLSIGPKIIKTSNIQRAFGRVGKAESYKINCNTTLIAGNSGNRVTSDQIHIPEIDCLIRLNIAAVGYTKVISEGSSGTEQIYVQNGGGGELGFHANLFLPPTMNIKLILQIPLSDVIEFENRPPGTEQSFIVSLNLTRGRTVDLELNYPFKNDFNEHPSPYLKSPEIFFTDEDVDIECQLLLGKLSGQGLFVHTLNEQTRRRKVRYGSSVLPNLFKLVKFNWEVSGGHKEDTFSLEGDTFTGSILGFKDSVLNTLILSHGLNRSSIEIDLKNHKIGHEIRIRQIQVIQGRESKREKILAGCDTRFINGGGGAGPGIFVDHVIIPNNPVCSNPMNLTIVVSPFTLIQNMMTTGHFIYSILNETNFRIQTQSPNSNTNRTVNQRNLSHFYQFQFGFNGLKSVRFDPQFKGLDFFTKSRTRFFIPMIQFQDKPSEEEYSQPKIQFKEFDERTGGNYVLADVRVMKDKTIYTSIKIDYPFNKIIQGIQGSQNNFLVDLKGNLLGIRGSVKEDSFWINSMTSIDILDGGSRKGNSLTLGNDLHQDEPMRIDLREGSGSITFPLSNSTLIGNLSNIQILRGREGQSGFERVYVSCDTSFVGGIEDIWVTDKNCSKSQELDIVLGQRTIVTFSPEDVDVVRNSEQGFSGGSYFYRFTSLRSFDPGVEFWFIIRDTRQICYFNFNAGDLDDIYFTHDSCTLSYVILNQTYTHSMDPFLIFDQQFYAQPQFMSQDGFHIQVSRHGDIFMTLATPEKELTLDVIQNQLIPEYTTLANRLGLTIIVQIKSDFLYIEGELNGDGSTKDPNILTNTDLRSHLVGSGSTNTSYSILDLQSDVYIYTGLENYENISVIHMIDLSDIIWTIRNKTGSKYVPKVFESNGWRDLRIEMTGWVSEFEGSVIIFNGVKLAKKVNVLLNAVVMSFHKVGITANEHGHVEKRETGGEGRWVLKPNPIVINPGQIVVLSPEDLEDGQKIISNHVVGFVGAENEEFEVVRNESELILTTLGKAENLSLATTFVILDFYNDTELTRSGLKMLKDVSFNFSGILILNATELKESVSDVKEWKEVKEDCEINLLTHLPSIPRQFQRNADQVFNIENAQTSCNKSWDPTLFLCNFWKFSETKFCVSNSLGDL